MSKELIINGSLPETRVVLMEEGEIQELLIERASEKGIVGNIYKGRVTRVLPGMQAAFVDIGLEKAAFLYVDDVFVHTENFDDGVEDSAPEENTGNEGSPEERSPEEGSSEGSVEGGGASESQLAVAPKGPAGVIIPRQVTSQELTDVNVDEEDQKLVSNEGESIEAEVSEEDSEQDPEQDLEELADLGDDGDDEEGDDEPVAMSRDPQDGDSESSGGALPPGVIAESSAPVEATGPSEGSVSSATVGGGTSEPGDGGAGDLDKQKQRRGRRGGRNRRRGRDRDRKSPRVDSATVSTGSTGIQPAVQRVEEELLPDTFHHNMIEGAAIPVSDRGALAGEETPGVGTPGGVRIRPTDKRKRPEFQEPRSNDRRIKSKEKPASRGPVSIQDLLKEGQEVIVQIAKDPIATKGARLTCHISLPGRHLVCMPTIDHVGVSRRIERDDDRRRLRDLVEKNRPSRLGFIVRTAGGKQPEKRIKQDIEYLAGLWTEIKEKSVQSAAPALIYEDLNPVLRAIRDWVNEEIDKIIVDSRFHFHEIQNFVARFMPAIKHKVEQYHGDIPIFDAYSISTELSRALERKVWLKSGGYIVIDQAEALVAIDVNTGRFVGKRSLEDTILKTNLEAVKEIAYQLRLRNCGGIIILDLIDMEREENKQRVYRALEEELKKDRARPSILKISELGLVEMTRKRTRDTITRTLCESCSHCEGKGYIKSSQTVAYEILREVEREGLDRDVNKILVQAHANVIDILAIEERETVDQLEKRYRKQIYLQVDPSMHPEQFEVVNEKKARSEKPIQPTRKERPERSSERSSEKSSERSSEKSAERASADRPAPERRERGKITPRSMIVTNVGSDSGPVGSESGATEPVSVSGPVEAMVVPGIVPAQNRGANHLGQTSVDGATSHSALDITQGVQTELSEEKQLENLRSQAAHEAAIAGLNGTVAPDPTLKPERRKRFRDFKRKIWGPRTRPEE